LIVILRSYIIFLVRKFFTSAKLKVLSGLFTNLSAGWIGAVVIFPNFSDLSSFWGKFLLTFDVIAAIVCLIIAFWFEERSKP